MIRVILIFMSVALGMFCFAGDLPGSDVTKNLTTVGTFLKTLRTIIIVYGAAFIGVIFVLCGAFAFYKQKFVAFGCCIVAAVLCVKSEKITMQIQSSTKSEKTILDQ